MDQPTILAINQAGWNTVAHRYFGATALPEYGPLAPSDHEVQLLGSVAGLRVLDIGCGSGHSLLYLAQQGARELWGLDPAAAQIDAATALLHAQPIPARLFTSPMEVNPGIPAGYFDLVVSIYALGWSANLDQTFAHIADYLKPGGRLVFSWEHPIHHCVRYEADQFVVQRSYHVEEPRVAEGWNGTTVVKYPRKISTFVNAVLGAGLRLERLLEPAATPPQGHADHTDPADYYSLARAALVPTTFIVCATKPGRVEP